jgi:hypothetical protein
LDILGKAANDHEETDDIDSLGLEETQTPVPRYYIESLPLIRPRSLHGARIRLYGRFPSLGLRAEKRASARLAKSADRQVE